MVSSSLAGEAYVVSLSQALTLTGLVNVLGAEGATPERAPTQIGLFESHMIAALCFARRWDT